MNRAVYALAAAVVVGAAIIAIQMNEDRVQRQCRAYFDTLGSNNGAMKVLIQHARGGDSQWTIDANEEMSVAARSLKLTAANRAYCDFPEN